MIKTVSGIASKNSFLMIDFVIDDEGDYENSMTGSDRRQEILKNIKESDRPVSGSKLAKDYDVSRQVIVQDIALLRASGYDIISTNRGYVLEGQTCAERVFKVRHTDEQLETELCTIVDLGGQVKNVMVNHKVYGHIEAELGITSRRKVKEFLEDIESGKSTPLKNITSDYHYHTVTADSEETLGLIEGELRKLGFLVEN
nr:transcription repressor NadR [Dorea formicigenerans]